MCSIASYYGVGLEVLRTDLPNSDSQNEKKNFNQDLNKEINNNLNYYSREGLNTQEAKYRSKIDKEAVTFEFNGFSE